MCYYSKEDFRLLTSSPPLPLPPATFPVSGFTNLSEVPATLYGRAVVYRQTIMGMYSEVAYMTAVLLVAMPVSVS